MIEFIRTFTVRKAAWWTLGFVIFLATILFLITLVSKAHKLSVRKIFDSPDVSALVGTTRFAILFGYNFRGSGTYSCSKFSYWVIGNRRTETVGVVVTQKDHTEPMVLSPLDVGRDDAYRESCSGVHRR
jgi:hypothetical protein